MQIIDRQKACDTVNQFLLQIRVIFIVFSKGTINWFKDTPMAFDDFKNKQKSVWSNVFWYIKICIFWKCI